MTGQQSPPEISIALRETKGLKNKSVLWENIELPTDILLLTVNECEFLSCLSFLNSEFSKSYHKSLGFVFFGDIGEDDATKLKIALMKCSAGSTGPGGSTVVVQNAVAVLRPKAVISVGYCASLIREKAKLGDVVVSAKLTTYAPIKVGENGDIEELGHSVPPKKHLADLIKSVDDGWEAPLKKPGELVPTVFRDGVFLSGPEEVKSQQRCAQLKKRFPNAVAIEMEGEGKCEVTPQLKRFMIMFVVCCPLPNIQFSQRGGRAWLSLSRIICSCLDIILITPSINCLTRLRQELNSRQTCIIYKKPLYQGFPVLTSLFSSFCPTCFILRPLRCCTCSRHRVDYH